MGQSVAHHRRWFGALSLVAAILAACTKAGPRGSRSDAATESDASLAPLDTPQLEASAFPTLSDTPPPPPPPPRFVPVAPGGHKYSDGMDLPANAGEARCGDAGAGGEASVHLEVIVYPRTVELVIPSLGVRRRLWRPAGGEPSSCDVTRDPARPDALRYHCVTDEGSVGGKVYGRGSDVILGTNGMSGDTVERFKLPCGIRPRFEPVRCPPPCLVERPNVCQCYPEGVSPYPAPVPTSTR